MPLGFALSDASYVKLEESFGLGDQVLPMISKNGGQQMCRLHYSSKDVLESVGKVHVTFSDEIFFFPITISY